MRFSLLAAALGLAVSLASADVVPEARSRFEKAEIAREEGRLEEAVQEYRAALEVDPLYVEAHVGYQEALRGLGDASPAREFLAKIASEHPDRPDLKAFHAASLVPAEARAALDLLVASYPDCGRAWLELGRVHLRAKSLKDAERALREAVKRDRELKVARLLIGDVYFRDGKYPQARKEYEEILAAEPSSVPAQLRLALCWHRQGKSDKALEILTKVVSDAYAPRLVAGWWLLAVIHDENKDYGKALEAVDKVLSIDKEDWDALLAKGAIHLRAGQPNEAVKVFTHCTELRKEAGLGYFCLGWAYERAADSPDIKDDARRKEKLVAAAGAYETCTRLDPGVRPRDSLGFVYLLGDKFEDAVTQLKRAADIDPRFAPAQNNLGLSDDIADRRPEAMKKYEAVLAKIDKENVRAHVMLGLDLWLQGAVPKATAELQKAVKLDPADDLAWTFLGDIYLEQGREDDALNAYKKATDINDKNFFAWYHAGTIYDLDKKKDEEADRCYRKAIEARIDPPADIFLRLGILNDEEILNRPADALKFYQQYVALGGTEDWVPERVSQLKDKLGAGG